jgi:flavin-dependent dehydrogenase
MRYDAIVIGGGPAGSTAALLLARAGWSIAIVEKSSFPRRKVCGEFISATSMPLLHELGVLDGFLHRAGPEVRRVGLFAKDATLSAPMPQPANAIAKRGRALGREHLDSLLLHAAQSAGVEVRQPWKANKLRRAGRDTVCTIEADGKSIELMAPLVIAAHGSWEHGSLPTQAAASHRPADLLGFKAHFTNSDLPLDLMPLLAFPGGYGGMVHTDGGRISLSCCIRRDTLQQSRRSVLSHSRAAETVLHHIQSSCAGARDALKRAALDDGWLSAGPIRPGVRERYADGIFRVGNCAGEAHPIVAEGISMAMQSAALLCRLLIAGKAAGRQPAEIGSRYAAEWDRAFAPRIRASSLFATLAMSPAAASLGLPLMKSFPGLLTFGAHLSGKTNQAYAET